MTESYPTNFHNFFKRKMLTATETIEGLKEVTAAQKTAIEASDAAWVRPPQMFIDQWNEAAGTYGTFNEGSGFFELNGLTDITYEEALLIYRISAPMSKRFTPSLMGRFIHGSGYRTIFPIIYGHTLSMEVKRMFEGNKDIEVVRFLDVRTTNCQWMFWGCTSLRRVESFSFEDNESFIGCINLEYVGIYYLSKNLNLKDSPKLTTDCFNYIIRYKNNTTEITITVHPDVFAKLTDESNEEWHAILLAAAEKQINFATV